jgi:Skp family chaperone for outer membrane proteins
MSNKWRFSKPRKITAGAAMLISYARVSNNDQVIHLQRDARMAAVLRNSLCSCLCITGQDSRPGFPVQHFEEPDFRAGMRVKPPRKPKESFKFMKRSLSLVYVLTCGMCVASVAQAVPARPNPASVIITGTTKIATIDLEKAVVSTNEWQRDLAEAAQKYAPRFQAINQLDQQIQAEQKRIKDDASKLSDADLTAMMRDVDDKTKTLERNNQALQDDEHTAGQDFFNQVASKVREVTLSYAQQHGFDFVFNSDPSVNSLIWATPGADITKAVIEAYNAKSGIPAPLAGVRSAPSSPNRQNQR